LVVEATVSPFALIGLADAAMLHTNFVGETSASWGYYQDTGQKYTNNVGSAYGASWKVNGDIIGIAADLDTGKIWWAKNGVWQNSGDPAAGTGEAFSGLSGVLYPAITLFRNGASATARFDPADQTYSAPSGFTA